MAETQVKGRNIGDGSVGRPDLNVATSGQAVIARILEVANSGVKVSSSTGADSGTGDVGLALDWNLLGNTYQGKLNGTGLVRMNGTSVSYDNNSYALASSQWKQSTRDFALGTLIQSDIDYSQSGGDAFLLEIEGNSYSSAPPFDLKVQGYIYSDTLINVSGVSNGHFISGLVATNVGGKLCFWFPRFSYWQGFGVFISAVTGPGYKTNRLVSVTDSAKPAPVKEVDLSSYIVQSWHTANLNNSDAPFTAKTLTLHGSLDSKTTNSNFFAGDVNIGYTGYQGYKLAVNGPLFANSVTTFTINSPSGNNLHLDAVAGNSIYMNWYYSSGGVIFGNGSQSKVAGIDGAGNITGVSLSLTGSAIFSSGTLYVSNFTGTLYQNFLAKDLTATGTVYAKAKQVTDWNSGTGTETLLGSESGTANQPISDYIYGTRLKFHRSEDQYHTDLVAALYNDRMFFRRKADNVYQNWREFFHNGNLNKSTIDFEARAIVASDYISSASWVGAANGISLYSTQDYSYLYGIKFTPTATSGYGIHGAVTGDYATYFNTDASANRGWIFRVHGSGNVASINNLGVFSAKGIQLVGSGAGILKTDSTGVVSLDTNTYLTSSSNVASATKLQTARTINGVLFDGTADITTTDAHVQSVGTTDITGTANESTMSQMITTITPKGQHIRVLFSAPFTVSAQSQTVILRLYVNNTMVAKTQANIYSNEQVVSFHHLMSVTSWTNASVYVTWQSSTAVLQKGSTGSQRKLTVIDLP